MTHFRKELYHNEKFAVLPSGYTSYGKVMSGSAIPKAAQQSLRNCPIRMKVGFSHMQPRLLLDLFVAKGKRKTMKRILMALFVCTVAVCFAMPAAAENTVNGNINFFFGGKTLDDVWEPADEHTEFGVMTDFAPANFPVNIVADIFFANDDGWNGIGQNRTRIDIETIEMHVGARKYFAVSEDFSPYVGGGVAAIRADLELASADNTRRITDDEMAYGWWAGFGAKFRAVEDISFGVDFRYSNAEAELAGEDEEVGGYHAGMFVGIGF